MINDDETQTYENVERAIVKRLTEKLNTINPKFRTKKKLLNSNEILKLSNILAEKFYNRKDGFRLTTEYLNFLVRFYTKKNNNVASHIVRSFLKSLDLELKKLNIAQTYKNYHKLIHSRIKDYDLSDDENDASFFEDTATNSHILYSGKNTIHYIN